MSSTKWQLSSAALLSWLILLKGLKDDDRFQYFLQYQVKQDHLYEYSQTRGN
jgi:hypothetical protein